MADLVQAAETAETAPRTVTNDLEIMFAESRFRIYLSMKSTPGHRHAKQAPLAFIEDLGDPLEP